MSGPETKPTDLKDPSAGGEAQTSYNDLLQAMGPKAGAQPAQAAPPSDQVASGQAAPQEAPQAPVTPPPSDQPASYSDLLHAMQGAGGAPAPQPSDANQVPGNPVAQLTNGVSGFLADMVDAFGGLKASDKTTTRAQIASEFATHPQGKLQIFQRFAGPGYESRLSGDEVEARPAGSQGEWKAIKPDWFSGLHGFLQRTADLLPDIFEGGVMGAATIGGAAEGAAVGAAAGGVGAIPGSLVGAMASGAISGTAAAGARQVMARLLGSDVDPNIAQQAAMQAGVGAALPVVGAIFRRPAQAAAQWLATQAESSQSALAVKVGEYAKQFGNIYQDVTGKAFPTTAEAVSKELPSTYEAGARARTAIGDAETKLGRAVGDVYDAAERKFPGTNYQLPNLVRGIEDTLTDAGYEIKIKPRVLPDDPIVRQFVPSGSSSSKFLGGAEPELKALHDSLADAWRQMSNEGGMKLGDIRKLQGNIQKLAEYGSEAPTATQRTYRDLYSALRTDRNQILTQATQGTEQAAMAQKAFSDYSNKIDDLSLLSRGAEKSPEKFAAWLFKDADTAKLAKAVLSNPGAENQVEMNGWDAVRGSWFRDHMGKALDKKTNIVDMAKLYERVNTNPEIAKEVMGPEKLGELYRLGLAMSRTSWEELVAKPDSARNSGILRAMAKFGLSGWHPAYGANALGALAGYDKGILTALNDQGILAFAKEAQTLQERNWWTRASRMVGWLAENSHVITPAGPSKGLAQPIERSFLPVILNSMVRPAGEPPQQQSAQAQDAYKMFLEKQQARSRQVQADLAQAQASNGSGRLPQVQLSSVGPGVPPTMPHLNIFAPRRGGHIHSGGRH